VENSPRQNAHYTSVSLDNSLVNANPAIAESLQQLLQKVNLNSHNFYYYSPPVGNKKVKRRGPNTSTPSDLPDDSSLLEQEESTESAILDLTLSNLEVFLPSQIKEGENTDTSVNTTTTTDPSRPFSLNISSEVERTPVGDLSSNYEKENSELDTCQISLEVQSKEEELKQNGNNHDSTKGERNIFELLADCDQVKDSKREIAASSVPDVAESQMAKNYQSSREQLADLDYRVWESLGNNNDITTKKELVDPKEALEPTEDVVRSRVEAYVNSLPTEMANLSKPESPVTPRSVTLKSPGSMLDTTYGRRSRILSEDEANLSVCSSRSRASKAASDLGSVTGRFGQGTIGSMYGVGVPSEQLCPFPDEWQYNTIPEVIENDDEID